MHGSSVFEKLGICTFGESVGPPLQAKLAQKFAKGRCEIKPGI